ncbi:hypothetical protein I317_07066 [Kwoniella heveanensis CBS 569]|nr:hypothetical protein I317_07066 [Kwoniella heveanensis CBS 569]
MATTTPRHVLIVGCGLGGPCLALSLARKGIRSTIFEIRPEPSESGGSISLAPNGLRVLDRYAGVYDRLRDVGFSYHRFGAYVDDGEKLGEIVAGEVSEGEKGYPSVRIMRSGLLRILLEGIRETEGKVEIQWGARISGIKEDEHGVTASLEDGSEVTGDILIGADGIHSKVREHILGAESPKATYEGICLVNGFVPASSVTKPSPDFTFPSFVFTSSGMLMSIPIDRKGETLAWGINMTVKEERSREGWKEFGKSGEAARLAKADYDKIRSEPVRSLLDNANDSQARLWPIYAIPDDIPKWHTPRVCLIGDAAHALPPNAGQGSAMAFEDSAIMVRLLTDGKFTSYDELFAKFESVRRARIAVLKANSKAGGVSKAETGPWMWYLKKWAYRGFFWWKRGQLQMAKLLDYDVDGVDLA